MTELNFLTRRRFLWTANATGADTSKGCTLTPPCPSDKSSKAQALSMADLPEANWIQLSYTAIVQSALLTIKEEFFARNGMTELSRWQSPSRKPLPTWKPEQWKPLILALLCPTGLCATEG